jgi:stage II sporulation protein AA (anti-sigma F factor antagonist)
MDIIFDVIDNILVAELVGELDHHVSERVRVRIDTALENYKTKNLMLDFSQVSFMDSSGIGIILGRYRKLGQKGSNMAIVGCNKSIRNILNMAGVFSIIDYYSTREEAAMGFDRMEVS